MSRPFLFDFTPPSSASAVRWRTINDDVMRGVSQSQFEAMEEGAAFTGILSLEHGGGFASVRSPESNWDVSDYEGVHLRLRGDGRRYWFTTYTEPGGPTSYRVSLQPSEEWTVVDVPFADLTPYRRGTERPDAPFQLEIAWIQAGRSPGA